jgi:hypothetical protein
MIVIAQCILRRLESSNEGFAKHLLIMLLAGLGCAASAQTFTNFYWTNSAAGAWSDALNWTNGTPVWFRNLKLRALPAP